MPSTANPVPRDIPDATVARLPGYLTALHGLLDTGSLTVSSDEIAAAAGVNSPQVRKDLSHLGVAGVRGVGYDVGRLIDEITVELGLDRTWHVAIAGVGNLGRALAQHPGFIGHGFVIAALFDPAPHLAGTTVAGVPVQPDEALADFAHPVDIGVVATPPEAAQLVCDRFVALGIRSILNFAPCPLLVPAGVEVRRVDLSSEMHVLAHHALRRQGHGAAAAAPAAIAGSEEVRA